VGQAVETVARTQTRRRRRASRRERVRVGVSAPVWVWLTALVVASTLLRFLLARRVQAPFIMIDELIYSELAKSFAAGGDFLIREQPYARYGPVYPVLISPAWRLFTSVPDAYVAAKAINALLMSLAALPAYFLARRVLAPAAALLGALFAVAVPSLAYTGTLMTENAAYPLVLAGVLALVLVLERPTLVRSLAFLGLATLAFLTRAQAVALLAGALAAPVLLVLARRRLRDVTAYAVLYASAAAGVLLTIAVQLGRGKPLDELFGAYRFVGHLDYSAASVAKWFVYHLAELDLYVGILPLVALLLLVVRPSRLTPREQAFLAAAVAVSAAFLVEAAMFASSLPWVRRIAERSMFYAAPLVLIAFLVWIQRGLPRPRPYAILAALAAAALPAVLPFGRLLTTDVTAETLALLPWLKLRDHGVGPTTVRALVLLGGLVAAVLLLRMPVRYRAALPAAVLVYLAVVLTAVESQFRITSTGALVAVTDLGQPDWVDEAAGPDIRAAVVWSGDSLDSTIWGTEFFNRGVGFVYDLGRALPGGLREEPAHVDGGGTVRDHFGRPVFGPYVLADRSLTVGGVVVARPLGGELTLYRVEGPVRVAALVRGRYRGDTWFRPRATYTRQPCAGGELAVVAGVDPEVFPQGQRVEALVGGRVVARVDLPPGRDRVLTLRVPGRDNRCVVTLRTEREAHLRGPPGQWLVGARYTVLAWR
jgi:hypothetical protein